jgi:hypothetical protein
MPDIEVQETAEEREDRDRSNRMYSAVGALLEEFSTQDILQAIADLELALHDMPGVSHFEGMRGMIISGEINEAMMRISKELKKEFGTCHFCWGSNDGCLGCEEHVEQVMRNWEIDNKQLKPLI